MDLQSELTVEQIKTRKGHEGEVLYSAVVKLRGKKVGIFSNADCGGSDTWDTITDLSLLNEISEFAATLPSMKYQGIELEMTAEQLVNNLIATAEIVKKIRKMVKSSIVFSFPDDVRGQYHRIPFKQTITQEMLNEVKKRHAGILIANEDIEAFVAAVFSR